MSVRTYFIKSKLPSTPYFKTPYSTLGEAIKSVQRTCFNRSRGNLPNGKFVMEIHPVMETIFKR